MFGLVAKRGLRSLLFRFHAEGAQDTAVGGAHDAALAALPGVQALFASGRHLRVVLVAAARERGGQSQPAGGDQFVGRADHG
jgi:hypothetical protein